MVGTSNQHQDVENSREKSHEMLYEISDHVPWHISILLAVQHYLTMTGSLVAIPLIITPMLCIADDDPTKGRFVSTIIFVSGILTILQSTFGVRLPIVQGGTFTFLVPTFALLNAVFEPCSEIDKTSMTTEEVDEIWKVRIREIQGSIIISGLCEAFLGATGLVGLLMRWITPLAITPSIALIGLSLFSSAADKSSGNWWISLMTISLLILFSQYLVEWQVPLPSYEKEKGFNFSKCPIFKSFPILLGICTSWFLCAILTALGAFHENSPARTDLKYNLMGKSPWFFVPYPFQYGFPTFSVAGIFGMLSGVLSSIIESVGDYYACSKISGAPNPPAHAVNRGIFIEGLGGVLAGVFGTGSASTSYSENIGALRITKVGSRRVIQTAGFLMMLFGVFGKFGAFCATIPEPLIGGLLYVMFSIITAVGLSNLQYVDMNSSRNLFVIGFSLFFGISFPTWITAHPESLKTGIKSWDQVTFVLLSTPIFVGGVLGFLLDNTIPGTNEERGLDRWREHKINQVDDKDVGSAYDLPWGMAVIRRHTFLSKLPVSPTYGNATT